MVTSAAVERAIDDIEAIRAALTSAMARLQYAREREHELRTGYVEAWGAPLVDLGGEAG